MTLRAPIRAADVRAGTVRRPERTLEALLYPARFEAFVGVDGPGHFDAAWRDETARPWLLANLAHAAYHSPARLRRWIDGLGVRTCRIYDRHGARGYLAVWDDKAVLVFRGTEIDESPTRRSRARSTIHRGFERLFGIPLSSWSTALLAGDVLVDLAITKSRLGEARVHAGFLRQLRKVWGHGSEPDTVAHDLAHLVNGVPLWITGHSLGGALATIAGMLHAGSQVVTFGEPKVGRDVHLCLPTERHQRIINGNDPVPRLPPRWLGYQHHGRVSLIRDPDGPNMVVDHAIVGHTQLLAPPELGRVVRRLG